MASYLDFLRRNRFIRLAYRYLGIAVAALFLIYLVVIGISVFLESIQDNGVLLSSTLTGNVGAVLNDNQEARESLVRLCRSNQNSPQPTSSYLLARGLVAISSGTSARALSKNEDPFISVLVLEGPLKGKRVLGCWNQFAYSYSLW